MELLTALKHEEKNLRARYASQLEEIRDRTEAAIARLKDESRAVSHHNAFNIINSATDAQMIAGQLEQIATIIRLLEAVR